MKLNRTFVVAMAFLIVGAFVVSLQMPRHFKWDWSFSTTDSNPFGCLVMDSVLRASMPKGYAVSGQTMWQLSREAEARNVLLVGENVDINEGMWSAMRNLMNHGSRIMVATSYIDYDNIYLADSVGLQIEGSGIAKSMSQKVLVASLQDSAFVTWHQGDERGKRYIVPRGLMTSSMEYDDIGLWQPLALCPGEEGYSVAVAQCRRFGRGEMIVVSLPLLFTNYGMLNEESCKLLFKLMSQISDRPVVRLTKQDNTGNASELSQSPFRVLLGSEPLRWALRLAVLEVLLFLLFAARRRQRVIPVVEAPRNHTLEFTRLIGTLFYQQHDHTALVRRKWKLFATRLRQNVGVDVESRDDDDHLYRVLAERTGLEYEEVARIISELRILIEHEDDIPPAIMSRAIDNMNRIERLTQ